MDEIQKALNADASNGLRSQTPNGSAVNRAMAAAKAAAGTIGDKVSGVVNGLRGAPDPVLPAGAPAAAPAPGGPVAPATARPWTPAVPANAGAGTGPGFTYGGANPGAAPLPAGGNPNVPVGGMSPQAAAYQAQQAARAAAPIGGAPAAAASSTLRTIGNTASKLGGVVSKAAPWTAIAAGGYNAAKGLQEGDNMRAGLGAADMVAGGALFTPAAPAAAVYLGGRAAYGLGKAFLPDSAKDAIGNGVQAVGNAFGQDWGTGSTPKRPQAPRKPLGR